nr:hypothetical protein [Tanacetum cinerariifolium]
MKGYIDNLERLGHPVTLGLGVSLILIRLRKEYDGFVQNYNMHNMGKTVNELHAMLKLHERTLSKSHAPALNAIRDDKVQKGNKHKKSQSQIAAKGKNRGKGKNKQTYAPKPKIPLPLKRENPAKDSICHEKRTQLLELVVQGLRASKKLKPEALSLYVANGQREAVEAIGVFYLCLPSKLEIVLNNCHYASSITRGVISVSRLYEDGFVNRFVDNTIQVSRNNMVYFSAIPRDGIFEIDFNKRAKLDLDSALLWHCRLGHICKKRIEKLQHDGLLDSSNLRAFEKCVSCMSGKMARKPYTHQVERAKDLLGLVHTDVCGPFKIMSRQGASYFVTFTDDFNRYGYVYLLKHKHEVFETFKVFQKDVENQLGYPKETMGYSFYYPPENKVLVARNAEFLENSLINLEASRSLEDLEIIQEEDTHLSIDTSLNHKEDDLEIDEPQSDIVPIRRSTRTRHAPDRICLYIDAEEHELGDLGEPTNYKAALLDPESEKWLNSMNVEMQSMKDNEVWVLVKLPPNCKTVGSKWLFKKKTDMDGNVHIYKARLVAKGYTQTQGLIMRKHFLQGFAMKDLGEAAYILGIKIYRDGSRRLIGLCQSAYIEKILKRYCMKNSKRGSIPIQEMLKLSKSQGASTPAELKRMQNVPYALVVGFIMYDVRCTRPDVAFAQNTGYVFVLNGGAVDLKSAKQRIFATSSAEAEYIAAFDASKEAVWVRKYIFRLGVVLTIEERISMYCDNTGAIAIANESGLTKGARHFRAKVHYLREVIEYSDIKLEKVHTDDNLADPFTNALAFPKHSEHTRNIRMLPASILM